jgi:hypothetical protein
MSAAGGSVSPPPPGLSIADLDDPAAVARHENVLMRRALADMRTADLRNHIRSHVRRMSTLVTTTLHAAGIDVATMMLGMRAGDAWSTQALVGAWARQGMMCRMTPVHGRHHLHGAMRRRGSFEIPAVDRPTETMVAEVVGNRIEFMMNGPDFILTTARGRARLTFDGSLPAVLAAIARGERLDRVVDHPLLHGAGLVVDGFESTSATTSIEFVAAELPVAIPEFGKGGTRVEAEG